VSFRSYATHMREALQQAAAAPQPAPPCPAQHTAHSEDPFTGALLSVLRNTRPARQAMAAAGRPTLSLGVHRSDYMLDAPSGGFLQVGVGGAGGVLR
jgi:glutathione synthase